MGCSVVKLTFRTAKTDFYEKETNALKLLLDDKKVTATKNGIYDIH